MEELKILQDRSCFGTRSKFSVTCYSFLFCAKTKSNFDFCMCLSVQKQKYGRVKCQKHSFAIFQIDTDTVVQLALHSIKLH